MKQPIRTKMQSIYYIIRGNSKIKPGNQGCRRPVLVRFISNTDYKDFVYVMLLIDDIYASQREKVNYRHYSGARLLIPREELVSWSISECQLRGKTSQLPSPKGDGLSNG